MNPQQILFATMILVSTSAFAARVEDDAQNQLPRAEKMRTVLNAAGTQFDDGCAEGRPSVNQRSLDSSSRGAGRAACPNF
jgi:hypothetical protein